MSLQKVINFEKIFFGILKVLDEKSRIRIWIRIRIRKLVVRYRWSGSEAKCHGSTTLVETLNTRMHVLVQWFPVFVIKINQCNWKNAVSSIDPCAKGFVRVLLFIVTALKSGTTCPQHSVYAQPRIQTRIQVSLNSLGTGTSTWHIFRFCLIQYISQFKKKIAFS